MLGSRALVNRPQVLMHLVKFERKFIIHTCCSVFPESTATLFLLTGDSANSSGFSLSSGSNQ